MLQFWCSWLVLRFLTLPVSISSLWRPFQVSHLPLVWTSRSCSTFFTSQARFKYFFFHFLKFANRQVFFFFYCSYLLLGLVFWPGLGDLFLSWNFREILFWLLFYSVDRVSHQRWLMVFHSTVCEVGSPQVSRSLLGILDDLKNAVVWMVSTGIFIFKSSRPRTNDLVTILSALITIGITVIFIFHCFF